MRTLTLAFLAVCLVSVQGGRSAWEEVTATLRAADSDGWTLIAGDVERGALLSYEGAASVSIHAAVPATSATKLPTATLILRLVQDGVLSLDDRVARWLPDWSQPAYADGRDRITLRNLLAMTSGILQGTPTCGWRGDGPAPTNLAPLSDCVQRIASSTPHLVVSPPGTTMNYAGYNVEVAGAMAEAGWNSTFAVLWAQLVLPHLHSPAAYLAADASFGPLEGGLLITTYDYAARLLPLILRPGALLSDASLRAEQYTASNASVNETLSDAPEFSNWRYGLGVWLEGNGTASSMGADGFYPVVDLKSGVYAVLVPGGPLQREPPFGIASGSLMVRSARLMRSLWPAVQSAISDTAGSRLPPPPPPPPSQDEAVAAVAARAQSMQLQLGSCSNRSVRVSVHHDVGAFISSKPSIENGFIDVHAYADSLLASVPPLLVRFVSPSAADLAAFRSAASPTVWLKLKRCGDAVVSAAAVNAATAAAAGIKDGVFAFERDKATELGSVWLATAVSVRRLNSSVVMLQCPSGYTPYTLPPPYGGNVYLKVLSREALISAAAL